MAVGGDIIGVRNYLDNVLNAYSKEKYYDEVKKAKEEFFQRTGKIAEGSEAFETQMENFLDWYVFDRPLTGSEISPIKLFLIEKIDNIDAADHQVYQDLANSIHSIFEVLKVKDNEIYLKDLFDGEKYVVDEVQLNKGFTKGDIFEGRLLKFKGSLVFGAAFVFHPKDVRSFILKQIKRIKYLDQKQRLKLLHKLAEMRLKMEQYNHISVTHIYCDDPVF
jgi:hypothetical protein